MNGRRQPAATARACRAAATARRGRAKATACTGRAEAAARARRAEALASACTAWLLAALALLPACSYRPQALAVDLGPGSGLSVLPATVAADGAAAAVLTATVQRGDGRGLVGVPLVCTLSDPEDTLVVDDAAWDAGASRASDANGRVVARWASLTPGKKTVECRADVATGPVTLGQVAVHFTAPAVPPRLLLSPGTPTPAAGEPFDLTVTAMAGSAVAAGYTGSVTLHTSDTTGEVPATVRFGPADRGRVVLRGLTLCGLGPATLHAADGRPTATVGDAAVTVAPGPAAAFSLAAPGLVAGTATDLTVVVRDRCGNVDTHFAGDVTLTGNDGATIDPAFGSVGFTAADGGVRVLPAALTVAADPNASVTARTGAVSTTQGNLLARAQVPPSLGMTALPAQVGAGKPVTVTLTLRDQDNNLAVPQDDVAIRLTADDAAVPAVQGVFRAVTAARVTLVVVPADARSPSPTILTATTDRGLTATAQIYVRSSSPIVSVLWALSDAAVAGVPQDLLLTVRDADGEVLRSYAGMLQISSSDPNAEILRPTVALDATNAGQVRVNGALRPRQIGGLFDALVQDSNGVHGSASVRDVVAGPATTLVAGAVTPAVTQSTTSATVRAGDALSWSLAARDAYDNLATGFTGQVTFVPVAGATLPSASFTDAGHGRLVASGLVLTTAGSAALTARAPGLSNATLALTVLPAAASALAFTTQPGPATGCTPFGAAVGVRDRFGNAAVPSTPLSVTVADAAVPAALLGTPNVTTDSNGVATFVGLSLPYAGLAGGDQHRLTATTTALAPSTSAPFAVTAPPALSLRFASNPAPDPNNTCVGISLSVGATCQPVDLGVTFQVGSGPATPIRLAPNSPNGLRGVRVPTGGTVALIWDAGHDLPQGNANVVLTATVAQSGIAGGAVGTATTLMTLTNGLRFLGSTRALPGAANPPFTDAAAGDLDGDGRPEILAVDGFFANTFFYAGTPQQAPSAGGGVGPTYLRVGDVDRDGKVDATTCARATGLLGGLSAGVYLRRNGGSPPYLGSPMQIIGSQAGGCTDVFLADLDGNATLDLVVPTDDNGVVVALGDGAGGFAGSTSLAASFVFAHGAALGDLFGQGSPALVGLATSGGQPMLVAVDPTGSVSPSAVAAPADVRALAVGDLNHDGLADVVVLTASGVSIYTGFASNNAFPSAPARAVALAGGAPDFTTLAVGDLDGDGQPDVTVAGASGWRVLRGDGTGALDAAAGPSGPDRGEVGTFLGDADGDGRVDLLLAGTAAVTFLRNRTPPRCGWDLAAPRAYAGLIPQPALATGDLDEDGRPDVLAVPVNGGGNVQIWRGTGSAALAASAAAPPPLPAGATAARPALGDLDGDGHLDAVILLISGPSLVRLRGDGHGQLSAATGSPTLPAGTGAVAVAVTDVDGDAVADVVVADNQNNRLLFYFGPRLAAPTAVPLPLVPAAVVAAPRNADGSHDVVVRPAGPPPVAVMRGANVRGGSGAAVQVPLGTQALVDLVADDLDGAAGWDLAGVTATGTVVVARGDTSGGFGAAASLAGSGCTAAALAAVHLGASTTHLALSCSDAIGGLRLVPSDLAGPAVAVPLAGGAGALVPVDLSGRGQASVVAACPGANLLALVPHQAAFAAGGTPSAALAGTGPLAVPGAVAVALGDLSRDGKADLAVATAGNTPQILLWAGDGQGGMVPAPTATPIAGVAASAVAIVDVDGDTAGDLVAGLKSGAGNGGNASGVGLWRSVASLQAPAIALAPGTTTPCSLGPGAMALADFDGDGKVDAARTAMAGSPGVAEFRSGDSGGTFAFLSPTSLANTALLSPATGDLDHDGWPDLVATGAPTASGLYVAANRATGASPALYPPTRQDSAKVQVAAIADVDGDGVLDVVAVAADTTLSLQVYRGQAQGALAPAISTATSIPAGGNALQALRLADVDGDGRPDVVLATGRSRGLVIVLNRTPWPAGAIAWGTPQIYLAGAGTADVALADLDQDGLLDVAVVDDQGGNVSLLFGR